MGLYTKKVKDEPVVKEVKKKGRPKKIAVDEVKEVEAEQPKEPEPAPVEIEIPKVEEKPLLPTPVEETPPPQEPVEEPVPLKKSAPKKKVEKKVEKKVATPKEDTPPAWFKKFISEIGHQPNESKKANTDLVKDIASKLWSDRVKPKTYGKTSSDQSSTNSYDKLYNQIFGR